MRSKGIIDRYRKFLPVTSKTPVVTLHEGDTPLIESKNLSRVTGIRVLLKCEGMNPTGSFKDRGMTLAVTKAAEKGAKAVLCASTGNTSASAAAYAARAGMRCYVILPEGAVALGKLSQAMMCRATIVPIKGNFDAALAIAREITATHPIALVNSVNPYRIEGQKTGSFEICDALGAKSPDFHLIPVGNAGNITAYWKGYRDYLNAGQIKGLPKMIGFQAAGAAPIVKGKPVLNPRTIATAIKIGNPASWMDAEKAVRESNGFINAVTDKEILKAYAELAGKDGVFVEPASAASVAGLMKLAETGYFRKAARKSNKKMTAVCILTGHGLKDPQTAISQIRQPRVVSATKKAVLKEIDR